MSRCLIPSCWRSALPPNHPERLPTFTPLVLGITGVLLWLSVLAGVSSLLLLAPLCLAGGVLLPGRVVLWGGSMAVGAASIWAIASGAGLPEMDMLGLRQVLAIAAVLGLSTKTRRRLLEQEWQWAAQTALAMLTQDEAVQSPAQAIAQGVAALKGVACADAVLVLRQLDEVTAEVQMAIPTTLLPTQLTTPALFAAAIAQNRCLYNANYVQAANAAPLLLARGVRSIAVVPLHPTEQVKGAILLLWYQPVQASVPLQQYIETLRSGLSNLLRFQDVNLTLDKLQARLVAILETIPQGIVFLDERGEQGWLNQTAAAQLGLPHGAAAPDTIAQAMTSLRLRADNSEAIAAQAAQLFARPQVTIRDWQWCFSQPPQVLSLSSTPVQLRQPGRLWVFDDITQRVQAEAALRQSEERFELIARATNDAVWDWDMRTNRVWWNEGMTTLFGYAEAEIGAGPDWWYANIHPDDRSRITAGIATTIAREQAWSAEYRYRRADGSYACVSDRGYVVRDASGVAVRMLGGMTDITKAKQIEAERVQAQAELERQSRRSQLFAEVTLKIRQSLQLDEILQTTVTEVQNILSADRVLVYRLWADGTGSGAAEALLPGLPSVLGHRFPEEVFPDPYRQLYAEGRIQSIANVADDQNITPCLVEFVQQFQVQAKLVVPILAQSELWGLLIAHQCDRPRTWTSFEIELLQQLADQIGIALTQAQLLEQETRQRQELVRSNTELQQFAYIASHDLQEPLRMVTSYLQLLERRYRDQLDADANDFISFAVDGAARMKILINDLLAYSRVGTHGKPFEPIDCNDVLQRVTADLQMAIAESGATVTSEPLPEVMGDRVQLMQLFQNLISNAIKFRGDCPPTVHISAALHKQEWLFAVRDNGIGIEPQYAERIFVIFQRLHRRAEHAGTGIGLAVCKKIVERHSGRIWVESAAEMGSTFYFTLPQQGDSYRE